MPYLDTDGLNTLWTKIKGLIPNVPSWAMTSSKPVYTASEVGAAPVSHTHDTSEIGSFATTSHTLVANCYIDNSNGTQISYSGWSATDYVDIQGKSVRVTWGQSSSWNAWYDSSKKFISGFSANTSQTLTPPANAKYMRLSSTSAGMASLSIKLGASLNDVLNTKQDVISDLATIRSGAAKGATSLQSFTETDPTVPSWAKQPSKPTYAWSEITGRPIIPEAVTDDHINSLIDAKLGGIAQAEGGAF